MMRILAENHGKYLLCNVQLSKLARTLCPLTTHKYSAVSLQFAAFYILQLPHPYLTILYHTDILYLTFKCVNNHSLHINCANKG